MEELFELRTCLEQQRYTDALILLGEMEEMSKEDKIHKIRSYLTILLLHLIKQAAEKRTTRSWNASIINSVREIQWVNQRRKAGGHYLTRDELVEVIFDAYPVALTKAASEAFEGIYDDQQFGNLVNRAQIEKPALDLILTEEQVK